ncbi:MAG TPA: LPS assembly lipoprotein LptE [Rhodanobacteraceae bacterium]
MKSLARLSAVLTLGLLLSACGFHLRRSAQLPAGMQTVYLQVSGNGPFRRALARALAASGSTVVEAAGPGVATLNVPVARFESNSVAITGAGRVSEYALDFHVRFDVTDANGKTLVPEQDARLSREYTYDASHAVGRETQVQAIRSDLIQSMVQSVMFRLQAAAEHAEPAPATSAAVPAATP